MADTDAKAPETATQGTSQTTVQTDAPAQGNAADQAEVERLRKEREQLEMERNQLRNKLEAEEKAKEEARQKKLEEDSEYKSLWEEEKQRREEAEREREVREEREALAKAKSQILADYPEEVRTEAEELGIDLLSESDADTFKQKLDRLNKRQDTGTKPKANNGRVTEPTRTRGELLQEYAKGNTSVFDEALANIPFIKENTQE